MPGEQDIVSLGLNIDSFNTQKMQVLRDFINLFDQLAKYDGKIINPVMGDGISKFNSSLLETQKILDDVNVKLKNLTATNAKLENQTSSTNKKAISEYTQLKRILNEQADAYVRLALSKGRDNTETQAALAKYSQTAKVIVGLDKDLSKAGGSAAGFTRGLSTVWSSLLRIAYILPGLGIAGIFNIAFDAIGSAANALFDFSDAQTKILEKDTEMNKALSLQVSLYKDLIQARKDYISNIDTGSLDQVIAGALVGSEQYSSYYKDKNKPGLLSSRGYNQGVVFKENISFLKKSIDEQYKLIVDDIVNRNIRYGSTKEFSGASPDLQYNLDQQKRVILGYIEDIEKNNEEITRLNIAIANKKPFFTSDYKKVSDKDVYLKNLESKNELVKKDLASTYAITKDYYSLVDILDNEQNKNKKFEEDQNRKRQLETSKDIISLKIQNNKDILSNDKKFHDEREVAINSNYQKEKELNQQIFLNVSSNISSTRQEIETARNKLFIDDEKAKLSRNKELEQNDVNFYQRKILALTEIEKDEIEMEAIKNERVFLNDKKSLNERLDAYEDYIIRKQKIKDLEYSLSIQKGASKQDGSTSLTPEEQKRLDVHRNTQQFNIQADAEKRTYEIVDSFLYLQLKAVKDANDAEAVINKDAYAKELSANNERFKNKIFAYEAFRRNKEIIDRKYGVILSEQDIAKDNESDVSRIKSLYEDLVKQKEKSDIELRKKAGDLDDDKSGGKSSLQSERFYNEELGRNNALNDAIVAARKEMNDAIEKGEDDKVKAAKARYEQLIQFEKEHASNRKAITEGLFEFAQKFVNRNVENEIRAIQDIQKTKEENYESEIDAIDKSSLDQKNKTALEIQLNQQKLESAKNAQAEERKLKHEAAVKDRELAIAHVMWNTIESVTSALKIAPPAGEILAAERGIIGAIQLANLLAVPIPSYKFGTDNHKGGLARFGEDGAELVKEPGKNPYVALSETIKELPSGTKVIPLSSSSPEFDNKKKDESWEQTKWLGRYIAKNNNKEIKNIIKPIIFVDMNFESRKRQILGN